MDSNVECVPAPRLPLELAVEFRRSYARSDDLGTLKNISITGAFLVTGQVEELSINDKLNITFTVSGRERQVQAHIVWKCKSGCGIAFKPFNNRDVQIVDDLMYFVESNRETKRNVLHSIFKKVS